MLIVINKRRNIIYKYLSLNSTVFYNIKRNICKLYAQIKY